MGIEFSSHPSSLEDGDYEFRITNGSYLAYNRRGGFNVSYSDNKDDKRFRVNHESKDAITLWNYSERYISTNDQLEINATLDKDDDSIFKVIYATNGQVGFISTKYNSIIMADTKGDIMAEVYYQSNVPANQRFYAHKI